MNRDSFFRMLPWVKSVFSVFNGNSPFRHGCIELLDGAGHPGAGNVQRIADDGHLHPDALPLQALDGIEIVDIGRADSLGQLRKQLPRPLSLIAGIQP